jgi:hypothetical protein
MRVHSVRLPDDKVEQLRQIVRERNFREKTDLAWPDLLREGADLVIQAFYRPVTPPHDPPRPRRTPR